MIPEMPDEVADAIENQAKKLPDFVRFLRFINRVEIIFRVDDPVFKVPQWVQIQEIYPKNDKYEIVAYIFNGEMLTSNLEYLKEHPIFEFEFKPSIEREHDPYHWGYKD